MSCFAYLRLWLLAGAFAGLAALPLPPGQAHLCAVAQTVAAPAPAQPASGATLFHERGCEYCHGAGGIGTEKGPSLKDVGRHLKPSQIEQQIAEGGGGMPPFNEALTPDEISRLAAYVAQMKRQHALLAAPELAAPAFGKERTRR